MNVNQIKISLDSNQRSPALSASACRKKVDKQWESIWWPNYLYLYLYYLYLYRVFGEIKGSLVSMQKDG